MRWAAVAILSLPAAGCIIAYGAGAAAPGRIVPAVAPGEWDIAWEIDVTRNVGNGVEVQDGGTLRAQNLTPFWGSPLTLAVRFGLVDGVGLEFRGVTSSLFPWVFFPVPNGLSLSPVIRIGEIGEGLKLYTMPRAVVLRAEGVAGGPSTSLKVTTDALGLEAPILIDWKPADWFDLTGSMYYRAYYLSATRNHNGEISKGSWFTHGGGATVNPIFTWGVFRLGLGVGVEVSPNPGAALGPCETTTTNCDPVFITPVGGLSLGFTWK